MLVIVDLFAVVASTCFVKNSVGSQTFTKIIEDYNSEN